MHSVGDRAVVEQGRENPLDRDQHVRKPTDVKKRLLLTGEGSVGHILRRSGRADRERPLVVASVELREGRLDLPAHLLGQLRPEYGLA